MSKAPKGSYWKEGFPTRSDNIFIYKVIEEANENGLVTLKSMAANGIEFQHKEKALLRYAIQCPEEDVPFYLMKGLD